MPFDPQPELAGELVELRPLRDEDFGALLAVLLPEHLVVLLARSQGA